MVLNFFFDDVNGEKLVKIIFRLVFRPQFIFVSVMFELSLNVWTLIERVRHCF
jgi:hypothetical protein